MKRPLPSFAPFLGWWLALPDFKALPASALHVLARLIEYRDYTKQIGRVGNARLMAETGFSRRAVILAVRKLEATRLIKCWYLSDGKRSTRYYHLAMNEEAFRQHCLQAVGLTSSNKGAKVTLPETPANKGAKDCTPPRAKDCTLIRSKYVQRKERVASRPESLRETVQNIVIFQ